MAETKTQQLRREWQDAQDGLDPGEDAVDRMLSNMATAEAGWHRVRGRHQGGADEPGYGYAYFPQVHSQGSKEARAAEDRWQEKALAMHQAQEAITLAPKPAENTMTRVTRGD